VPAEAGAEVRQRLEELLHYSEHVPVREAAANALGKIGSQESVGALVQALEDPAENVRWFAVEGLRKLGAVQAVPRLSQLVERDPSGRVREIAATTLGELGQPAGVPALRRALGDSNERVRQKAAAALMSLATDSFERMMVIAEAFRQEALYEEAQDVLTRAIDAYRDSPGMQDQVAEAYRKLAGIQQNQQDYASAAQTLQELDAYLGGDMQIRRRIVDDWLNGGDPSRAAAAIETWFADAGAQKSDELIELGLEAAERMFREGYAQEGTAVLTLVKGAVGETQEADLRNRIERLERRAAE
jgi:tetratricopeptide (TPR) repeat protein